ncbi:MAG: DUF1428 domain-containing protein [Paracoccus sp. (in: a-proteobacteria)]|uniref:DUF1428 domain-containing protein n=1 Tax=Paracoccus sp. TaxID=267 RepID=UPI00405987CD
MTYVSGFLLPVKTDRKEIYLVAARQSWPLFRDYGALHHVETWGVAVPDGKTTDFKRAVKLEDSETVVFSWIVWPDQATSDACEAAMETDPSWTDIEADMEVSVDGKRMIFGGFDTIFDERA